MMAEDFFPSVHPIPLPRRPSRTWRRVASERADAIECLADTRRKNRNQFLLAPDHYCFFYESKRRETRRVGGWRRRRKKKVAGYNGSSSETYGRKAMRKSRGRSREIMERGRGREDTEREKAQGG